MGLGDLFKPKWKHSDWKVRLEAVKELDDNKKLAFIAKNDSEGYVREEAVKNPNLSDEFILIDIAKNDFKDYVRSAAVSRISDESVLAYIAKNDSNDFIRKDAVKKISDESVLVYIAKNDSERRVCHAAVERISDESVLADVAKNTCTNSEADKVAVERISDEFVLADVAKNASSWVISQAAAKKINDESILIDIAKNNSHSSTRRVAVERISDESVLSDIAKNDEDTFIVKPAAAKKLKTLKMDEIKNESGYFYNDILFSFEKLNYTTASIYELGDYESLVIAENGDNFTKWEKIPVVVIQKAPASSNSYHTVKYISENFSNKTEITKRKYESYFKQKRSDHYIDPVSGGDGWKETTFSKFVSVDAMVISGISDKITDLSEMFYGCKAKIISFANCDFSNVKNTQNIFQGCNADLSIYVDETSFNSLISNVPQSIRYIDMGNIGDESVLIDIAKNNPDNLLRRKAVEKISDESVLIDIVNNDSNGDVCRVAKKRLKNLKFISKNNNLAEWNVCEDCGKKVKKMAIDVHKKCPHCGGISFKPIE